MLRMRATSTDIGPVFDGLEGDIAAASTTAMRGATNTLKTTLRDQVQSAGMGSRLANTWRVSTYPDTGNSLNPAGYAWSNAPDIIEAFATGATISPLGGKSFLWIPSRSVPRAAGQSRGSSTERMTPAQVLASFGLETFIFKKGRGGSMLAFVAENLGLTARGRQRRVRKGRLAHGDTQQLILMFTLRPTVKLPKKFDLDDAANFAAADYVSRFEQAVR